MRKHYAPSVVLIEMDVVITHAQEQGLPLIAIELSHEEWAQFKKALLAVPGWNATEDELNSKTIRYRGIKVYETAP